MLNRRRALVALSPGFGLGLAACGSSGPPGAGPVGHVHLAGKPGQLQGRCPQGRLLPAGVGAAIDYIDFFRLNGTSYEMVRVPIRASQLGPVIGHIRCSLTASEDPHRGAAPVVNGTASFLPAGAAVYQVRHPVLGPISPCRFRAYRTEARSTLADAHIAWFWSWRSQFQSGSWLVRPGRWRWRVVSFRCRIPGAGA